MVCGGAHPRGMHKAAVRELQDGQLARAPVDDDVVGRQVLHIDATAVAESQHHGELLKEKLGCPLRQAALLTHVRGKSAAVNALRDEAEERRRGHGVLDRDDVRVEEIAARRAGVRGDGRGATRAAAVDTGQLQVRLGLRTRPS